VAVSQKKTWICRILNGSDGSFEHKKHTVRYVFYVNFVTVVILTQKIKEMKILFLILAVFFLVYGALRLFRRLTMPDKLRKSLLQGAVILDVRTEKEYEKGHIDGAINISLGSLRERYNELDRKSAYITYCSHGLRSLKAQRILQGRGLTDVLNGGAMNDFEEIVKSAKSGGSF
jgi:phage shock protein E